MHRLWFYGSRLEWSYTYISASAYISMQSMSQSITQSTRIRSLSGLIFVYAYERQTADGRDEGQHAIARLSPIIETNITSIYSNQRFIVASTFQVDARCLLWLSEWCSSGSMERDTVHLALSDQVPSCLVNTTCPTECESINKRSTSNYWCIE